MKKGMGVVSLVMEGGLKMPTGNVCSAGKALRYLDWEETGCGRPGTRELLASLESGHGNGDDELVAAIAGEAVERGGSCL